MRPKLATSGQPALLLDGGGNVSAPAPAVQLPMFGNPQNDPIVVRGAMFSDDRTWRYRLWRVWGSGELDHHVAFIGLNPSTADESKDDPTMRRCIGFARSWGFQGFQMLNLFATRTPYPREMAERLKRGENIVGPGNDEVIVETARAAGLVIAAWGAGSLPFIPPRAARVLELLNAAEVELFRLGTNQNGTPKHPLYVPAATMPERFPVPV